MPRYKILTTQRGRWGEGWQYGDLVDLDDGAAKVPLEKGEIVRVPGYRCYFEDKLFTCDLCGKRHIPDSAIGQQHLQKSGQKLITKIEEDD